MERVGESTDFTKKGTTLCNSFLSACDGIRLLLAESTESEVQDDNIDRRREEALLQVSECPKGNIWKVWMWLGWLKRKCRVMPV